MSTTSPNIGLNIPVGTDTVDFDKFFIQNFNAIDGQFASGTTANRPSSPKVGQRYFNTDLKRLELWDGTAWRNPSGDVYNLSFPCSGSVNSVQLTFTFPTAYPTGSTLTVRPCDITQAVGYADVMSYPYIFSVSNTAFTVKLAAPSNFAAGTLQMNFSVQVK